MTTRNGILKTAASQIGYTEGTGYGGKSNYTKYWADLKPSYQGGAWCAAFVVWVLKKNGSELLLKGPMLPYFTPSMEQWAKVTGRWKQSKDCQPGDVLIFGNSNNATHTGFLVAQDGNYVITIEGNTSSGNGGSQTNGGGVYRRRRPRSWVRGCIDISSEITQPEVANAPGKQAASKLLDVDGELGPLTVKALQRHLKFTGKDVDGELGPITTKALQRLSGLTGEAVDGEFGPQSARALEKFLKLRATTVKGWYPGLIRGLQRYLNARLSEA